MNVDEFLSLFKELGNDQTKKIYENHGAKGTIYGVKIGDMKSFITQNKLKKKHDLGMALFDTDVVEAKYAAKYIVDYKQITKEDLEDFIEKCEWYMNLEYTIPDIAAQSPYGLETASEWVRKEDKKHLCAGYSLYSLNMGFYPNESLNIIEINDLLNYIEKNIHNSENRVRYVMNNFVIAAGAGVPELTNRAKEVAENIGKVDVYLGKTSCKVPDALPYIEKIEKKDRIGFKRKTIC
jgi:3-methyladenine DNA glycosylase AlkD